MEQRMTLISDKTDEFPNNANNSFKVRIPNGLRLEGTGWHVALLSLTLPNSSTDDIRLRPDMVTRWLGPLGLLFISGPQDTPESITR